MKFIKPWILVVNRLTISSRLNESLNRANDCGMIITEKTTERVDDFLEEILLADRKQPVYALEVV